MNSAAIESEAWKSGRWLFLLVLIFGSQLLLIYLLSARTHTGIPRAVAPTSSIQLFTRPINESEFSETFLANDPTLFAMANTHGFSGAAWLKIPERNYDLAQTPEATFWLSLNSEQLGDDITQFVRTNSIAPIAIAENVAPKILTSSSLDL
jgi:hypothetical protein